MNLLIKNFPDSLHKKIKAEAIKAGYTIRGYVIHLLSRGQEKKK